MVKRIFKFLGILLGSITAFCGAVFGVMALMGKFKTPVVYPTILGFEKTEITVVEGVPYEIDKDYIEGEEKPSIYSFRLLGTNPNEEHAVNKPECYVWFDNVESSHLITLCDENRNPLIPSNNKYLVNCNEPIYFMVNKIANDGMVEGTKTDGTVTLMARSTNDTLKKPDTPLTIYIDREVEAVFVQNGSNTPNQSNKTETVDYNTQTITRGAGIDVPFDYSVITELSLKPIESVNAKDIELYYDASGLGIANDYIKVTQEEVENENSYLHSFMRYENNKFILNSADSAMHKFVVAIFPTYEAKLVYEEEFGSSVLESPNQHRAQAMLKTKLTVEILDIAVTNVSLTQNDINLNLYNDKDYITLSKDNAIDLEGAKNNNLSLQMFSGATPTLDYSRFDGVNMNGFALDNERVWAEDGADIIFANSGVNYVFDSTTTVTGTTLTLYKQEDKDNPENQKSLTIVEANLKLTENLVVIDYLLDSSVESSAIYRATNGVAVLDKENNKVKLLKSGNYMNFYIHDTVNDTFTLATSDKFSYTATAVEGLMGKEKSWNIVAESMPNLNENEKLVLGMLVINGESDNNSGFRIENLFAMADVNVNEVEIDYAVLNKNNTIQINFTETEQNHNPIPFEEIISITKGSYTAGVLVTTEKEGLVKVLENLTFKDDTTTYYIVGYVENGEFVNAVKLREGATVTDGATLSLQLLQLFNGYNKTAEVVINGYLEEINAGATSKELGNTDASLHFVENGVATVSAQYILNTNLLSHAFYEGTNELTKFYENTEGYKLIITSTNPTMLQSIFNFYNPDETNISFNITNGANHIIVTGAQVGEVEVPEGEGTETVTYYQIEITFKVGAFIGENKDIVITLNDIGGSYGLSPIQILSGNPDNIVFNSIDNATEDKQLLLSNDEATVGSKDNANYINMLLDLNGGVYTGTFSLVKGGITTNLNGDIFNLTITNSTSAGFQGAEDKKQKYNITYTSKSPEIVRLTNEDGAIKVTVVTTGTAVIEVKIGDTVRWFKLVVDGSHFVFNAEKEEITTEYTDFMLSNAYTPSKNNIGIDFIYNSQVVLPTVENGVVIDNVQFINYGDGTLKVKFDNVNNIYTVYKENDPLDTTDDQTVLTLSNTADGWRFEKKVMYTYLTISFDIKTFLGTKSVQLLMNSNVSVSVNAPWAEKEDRVIYLGTEVQLQGTDYSIFNLSSSAGTDNFKYNLGSGATQSIAGKTYIATTLGTVTFAIYYGENYLNEYEFTVVPNVKASEIKTDLTSETEYELSNLFTLESYPTDIVYGSSVDNLYDKVTKQPLSAGEISNLSLKESVITSNPTLTYSTNKLTVGAMTNLSGTTQKTLQLVYNGVEISTHTYTVSNIYSVNFTSGETNAEDEYLFKANKEYTIENIIKLLKNNTDPAEEVAYELTEIIATGYTFNGESNKFTFTTTINEEKTIEATFKLTINKGELSEQEFVYVENILVMPYTPDTKTNVVAYSGSSFDLLKDVYDLEALLINEKVSQLMVNGIFDTNQANANNITLNLLEDFASSGFVGNSGDHCQVTFNELSLRADLEKIVYVQYTITYEDNTTYTYYLPLKLNNRQKLVVTYPEKEATSSQEVTFNFVNTKAGEELSLDGTLTYNMADVLVNNFEPMLVYTNATTTLNFASLDSVKQIHRATISNEATNTSYSKDTTLNVELVAYQNIVGMAGNVNKVSVKGTEVTFEAFTTQVGFNGILIFKLSSVSEAYTYYYVRVYCKGAVEAVNTNNHYSLVAYYKDVDYPKVYTETQNINTIEIDGTKTYKDLITSVTNFSTVFGLDYNETTTSMYLYNGTNLNYESKQLNSTFDYNNKQWSKVDSNTLLLGNDNQKFTTLTLGLMYTGGVEQYIYGTITVYVQPNIAITSTGVNYNVPNGEFTKEIEASATEITCPFGEDWIPNVLSITAGAKVYNEDEIKSLIETDDVDTSKLNLLAKVAENTFIRVAYTNGNTTVVVTYEYLKTEIPTVEEAKVTYTVGAYNGTKFNNTVDLNQAYFMGSYAGDITIDAGGTSGVTIDGTKLTFTQTNKEWSVDVKITYNQLDSTDKTRTFTFKVLPGTDVSVVSGDTSGLNDGQRHATYTGTIDYENETGSTLTITKTEDATNNVYSYTIAGYTVRTNADSTLKLTFNDKLYVLDNTDGTKDGVMNVSLVGDTVINFPHLAENKSLNVLVETYVGTTLYTSRNIYLTVAQTYSNIRVKYLVNNTVDNIIATHENVVAGQTVELSTTFVNSSKIELFNVVGDKVTTSYDLEDMGFKNIENPNYLTFTVYENGTISGNNLTFSNVTDTNKLCELYINNKAGIVENSVKYTYQIMESGVKDGLNYAEDYCDGYYDATENYVSFMMGDTQAGQSYEKTFKLGKILDTKNKNVFSLTSYVDGTTVVPTTKYIEDGLYKGTLDEAIGGFANGIEHSFSNEGFKFYVMLNTDNGQVCLRVERTSSTSIASKTLKLSLGGVNGAGSIAEDLNIYLSTEKVSVKEENEEYIFANSTISLDDIFEIENGTGLTYELAESSYILDGKSITILASQTENNLFDFVNNSLEFHSVGQDVKATINFVVKKGDYVITTITYSVTVKLNLQIVANGTTWSNDLIDVDTLSTNLCLTLAQNQSSTPTQFPVKINLIDRVQMATLSNTTNDQYYSVLVYDLYFRNGKKSSISNIGITTMSNQDGWVLGGNSTDGYYLQFTSDYSGEIELLLKVDTYNGVYSVNWVINVIPIISLEYSTAEGVNGKLSNNSYPFSTGTSVSIISPSASKDVGVVMKITDEFENEITGLTAAYKYNIVTKTAETATYSNEALFKFDASSSLYQGGNLSGTTINLNSTGKAFEAITLPQVPSSLTNDQIYLVTYEVYVNYLNLDENRKTFYVTYEVVNSQKVETYTYTTGTENPTTNHTASVNVDTLGSNNLDLFYYKETFTTASTSETTYTFIYSGDSVLMNGTKYEEQTDVVYDTSANSLKDGSGNAITATRTVEGYYNSGSVYSVFESKFNNIFEFKAFIDVYKEVEGGIRLGDKEFKLIEIENGRYGIDLTKTVEDTPTYTSLNPLFNNDMKVELALYADGTKTVSVPAYSSENVTGFRLYANSTIIPNSSTKLSDMFATKYISGIDENTEIIGVGEPTNNWVNLGTVGTSVDTGATINIPSGSSSNETYKIKKVTYSATGGDYYSISEDFYYIEKEVYFADYSVVSTETDHFRVSYPTDESATEATLNLTTAIKKWTMVDGKLISTTNDVLISGCSVTVADVDAPVYTSGVLSISKDALNNYKAENPTATNYPNVYITVTVNGINLYCKVVFALNNA